MSALAARLASLPVRGRISANAPLAEFTWFRVGGPADILFAPADESDLAAFMQALPEGVPLTILGLASNTLVRDGGIPGVTVRLSPRGFGHARADGTRLTVGAALPDVKAARAAADAAIAGLESTGAGSSRRQRVWPCGVSAITERSWQPTTTVPSGAIAALE